MRNSSQTRNTLKGKTCHLCLFLLYKAELFTKTDHRMSSFSKEFGLYFQRLSSRQEPPRVRESEEVEYIYEQRRNRASSRME